MRPLLVSLSLLLAVPALAAAPAHEDAAKVAASLAQLTLPHAQWDRMMKAMNEQLSQNLAAQGHALPPEQQAQLVAELQKMVDYQEMSDFLAGLFLKYYSVDEMHQLDAFYRSPVGKKALQIQPELMRDTMGFVQTRIATAMPAVIQRMEAAKPSGKAR